MHAVKYDPATGTKTLGWITGRYMYAKITLPIDARVLEVGGAQDPHPAADVIVEKFLHDNRHRMGGYNPITEGELVVMDMAGNEQEIRRFAPQIIEGDVVDMAFFKDKEFDFAITKDILEHVP